MQRVQEALFALMDGVLPPDLDGGGSRCPFTRAQATTQAIARLLQSHLSLLHRAQIAACASLLAAAALVLLGRARVPPGGARALATLPLLVPVNFLLPLLFDPNTEIISRAVSTACFPWMATCKLLAWCLNRGPLVAEDWGVGAMALLYALPIIPRDSAAAGKAGRLGDSAGTPLQVAGLFVFYCGFTLAVVWLLTQPLPPLLLHYTFGLYAFVSAVMGGPALLLGLASIEAVPPFDRPWMATSLADFWGRRWNNTIGQNLRCLFYDPIVEGRVVIPLNKCASRSGSGSGDPAAAAPHAADNGSGGGGGGGADGAERQGVWRRRTLGTALTFAASGVLHELLCWYVSRPYSWGIFNFFMLQAPLCLAEAAALRWLRSRGVQPPRLARVAAVQITLLLTAHWLFYPPLDAADTNGKFTAAVAATVEDLREVCGDAAAALGLAAPPATARLSRFGR